MKDTKEEFYTFKPRVHRHNDPSEYSKKSPRRFPRQVGELCADVFEEETEKIQEPKKVNFDFQFGGYKQLSEEKINPKRKTLKKY